MLILVILSLVGVCSIGYVLIVGPPQNLAQFGSILTGIGAILILWQVREQKRQFKTQFEDELNKEYRDIVDQAPTKAFLGEDINPYDHSEYAKNDYQFHDSIYRYLDLTNQQIHRRSNRRISTSTWENWEDGIQEHLRQPEIARTLHVINKRTEGENYDLGDVEHFSGLCEYLDNLNSEHRDPRFSECKIKNILMYLRWRTRPQKNTDNLNRELWSDCAWKPHANWPEPDSED
jgi:hypothetical protein